MTGIFFRRNSAVWKHIYIISVPHHLVRLPSCQGSGSHMQHWLTLQIWSKNTPSLYAPSKKPGKTQPPNGSTEIAHTKSPAFSNSTFQDSSSWMSWFRSWLYLAKPTKRHFAGKNPLRWRISSIIWYGNDIIVNGYCCMDMIWWTLKYGTILGISSNVNMSSYQVFKTDNSSN